MEQDISFMDTSGSETLSPIRTSYHERGARAASGAPRARGNARTTTGRGPVRVAGQPSEGLLRSQADSVTARDRRLPEASGEIVTATLTPPNIVPLSMVTFPIE